MAAKYDTDHEAGVGTVAITGRYHSKTDSFGIDAVYEIDDSSSAHMTYGVTEEKIMSLGMETGFGLLGRTNVVDLMYAPPSDQAALKMTVRQGKTKLSGTYLFPSFSTAHLKQHKSKYELSTKLNEFEKLEMTFDQTSKAAKVKLSRKLDSRNRLDGEYNYVDAGKRFVALTLKHAYNQTHSFSMGANYGTRKYKVEWGIATANGPWTINSSFGFNQAPYKGEWTLKRRFEF